MTIHAHPDDEASKGAGTVARLADEGVECTLVCCTGGEEGDILNPALVRPGVAERLGQMRMIELGRASAIIGYDRVELLGYRDSGMAGEASNDNPDSFHSATTQDAVRSLVQVIRRVRPQVIVTYGPDQRHYGHPDHLKVFEISAPAFEAAADPDYYPEDGGAWSVSKMYYVVWNVERMKKLHEAIIAAGNESPFTDEFLERWEVMSAESNVTTSIDVRDYYDAARNGLLAHATQVDPDSPFWFGVPDEVARNIAPFDTYQLAESRVPVSVPESDLFAGVEPDTSA